MRQLPDFAFALPSFRRHVLEHSAGYPQLPRGIWTSELFAFCAWAQHRGVPTIVESGLHRGQSRLALTRYFGPTSVYSIDRSLLVYDGPDRGDSSLFQGDAESIVPALLSQLDGPIALLLDGPKGEVALALAERAFSLREEVSYVAIHDMYRPVPPTENAGRVALDSLGSERTWCTDASEFRAYDFLDSHHERWLDEQGLGKLPYVQRCRGGREVALMSYGPTLGFVFRGM